MKKLRISLQWKFFWCIVLIIIPILGIIFTWAGVQSDKQARDQVVNQARILSRQIILTRQWITDCGGVFVNRQSPGAKDVMYFFDDTLQTTRGSYQRFTPSMVTRKLSQYSTRQDLYRFRLAGLNPLNPENKADGFEREALKLFRTEGAKETFRLEYSNGQRYFQYMVPLYMEQKCLKCHNRQEDSLNSIGGGLSVFLPVDKMLSTTRKNHLRLAVAGTALILITIFSLFFLTRRFVIKPLKKLEDMTNEISRGNLDARVSIKSGDELEKLGEHFNTMARSLSRGRGHMEERIAQATKELSDANRELQTLDKLKSDFLANMSHELRTPLTVVRGGIDYLNRTIKKEDNRNYLEIIDKNLARLIHLVSDLFDFTKIEARTIEWSFDQVNLSILIEEVIEIISPLCIDKMVAIKYENPGDVLAELDMERIEQVLVNLIENAIKFSDPATEIQIKIEEDPTFVKVSVRDRGPGISEENLKTIFDKFSTVPSAGFNKPEGTGLGLAICKAIVEGHDGKIWAESVKGESSTFYFTLLKKRP
ncbi:MAG: ATP-binding protein [Desulfobacterales bacterium]